MAIYVDHDIEGSMVPMVVWDESDRTLIRFCSNRSPTEPQMRRASPVLFSSDGEKLGVVQNTRSGIWRNV